MSALFSDNAMFYFTLLYFTLLGGGGYSTYLFYFILFYFIIFYTLHCTLYCKFYLTRIQIFYIYYVSFKDLELRL